MKAIPNGDRILIKVDEQGEITQGGIIIPDEAIQTSDKMFRLGTVVGCNETNSGYMGQRVMFGDCAGTPVEIDGEELLVLNKADIMVYWL